MEMVSRMHPTQKPVGLHVEIIQDYAAEDAIIFDGFLGSGTTMLASEIAKRECYGVEMSCAYVGLILERMTGMGCTAGLIDEALEPAE